MLLLERLPRWITRSRIISVVFFTFKKLLIKVLINILHERKKCGNTRSILKSLREKRYESNTWANKTILHESNKKQTKFYFKPAQFVIPIRSSIKFITELVRNIQQLQQQSSHLTIIIFRVKNLISSTNPSPIPPYKIKLRSNKNYYIPRYI